MIFQNFNSEENTFDIKLRYFENKLSAFKNKHLL